MAPTDVWPENAGEHEQQSGNQGHAMEGVRDDAGREWSATERFLYPVAVVAGVLFLIMLAAV